MLWQTFWYITSFFILTATWENDGSCIFQGQVICQVEMTILCKNVTFVTLNYLYLAHNTSKWSTLYILYHYVTYRTLYKIFMSPLGDKVSMLTHIYPHKARRKIEVIICKITRLTAHFMCGLVSDLLICTLLIKSMVIHDTECPYWDQVSLNNTNQTKP